MVPEHVPKVANAEYDIAIAIALQQRELMVDERLSRDVDQGLRDSRRQRSHPGGKPSRKNRYRQSPI
jgi:hypothetical protein